MRRHVLRCIRMTKRYSSSVKAVLGIETSCDDTGIAIVTSARTIVAEALNSQWNTHQEYGGVVPKLAARDHEACIGTLVELVAKQYGQPLNTLAGIAVTVGPGLGPCLRVGLRTAKQLSAKYSLPVIPVNHLEGHALVPRLLQSDVEFPFLTLLLSGGHSQILVCHDVHRYELLGSTLDDSLGEAFDKVARLLLPNLPLGQHGGEAIEALARQANGNTTQFRFTLPLQYVKNCDFSFSGLKSQVARAWATAAPKDAPAIAAAFQSTATQHIVQKTLRAIQYCRERVSPPVATLVVSGGVARNQYLRGSLEALSRENNIRVVFPEPRLCTDNGVMIAWAGVELLQRGLVICDQNEIQSLQYFPQFMLDSSGEEKFPTSPIAPHLREAAEASRLASSSFTAQILQKVVIGSPE